MSKDKSAKTGGNGATKKGKKGKKGTGANVDGGPGNLSISADPRARQSVRQIKSWVGLAGFVIALVLSLQAHVPLAIAGERALIAGLAGWLVGWGCAVAIWRALLVAELRVRIEAIKAAREQRAASAK